MPATPFQLAPYLKRIGLAALPDNPQERLFAVHRNQALSIPFENLDIHLGRGISVRREDIVRKIVQENRGGYCFELNLLMQDALRATGLDVRPRLARVLFGRPDPGPRSHLVLEVMIQGRRWLADTGFGGPGLFEPLPWEPGPEFPQGGTAFRLREDPVFGLRLERDFKGAWMPIYVFAEETCLDADIEMANYHTSTHPESPFTRMRMCAVWRGWGRATLLDNSISLTRHDGSVQMVRLEPGPGYLEALETHFGIRIGTDYSAFRDHRTVR